MTRPTDISGEIPLLRQRLGSEYPNPIAEGQTPVDRAAGIDVFVLSTVATDFVQSKAATSNNTTPDVSATFDDAPIVGNLLVALFTCRGSATPTFPAGWTMIMTEATITNGGPTWLLYRIATTGEPTTVTVSGVSNYKRFAIAEFSGVETLDVSDSLPVQSAAMSYAVGPITPTEDGALLVGWVNVGHKTNFTTDADWTAIDEDGTLPTGGTDGPSHTFAYRILPTAAATSFEATSVDNVPWCGGVAAFTNIGLAADAGPNATDADDATYIGPDTVYMLPLDEARRMVRARLRLAWEFAGSVALTLEGANVADFSDAVELEAVTVTATGSWTEQDVALLWESSDPDDYQYFRLTLATEARLHTWEMYEATYQPPISDHGDLDGLADNDHPQYALATDLSGYVTTDAGGGEEFQAHGAAGAAETIDLANGNYHAVTLDADVTLTFTAPAAGRVRAFTLEVTQNGTGGWDITWPASVVWPDGVTPTPDLTAGSVAFFVFHTRDAGTTWYGFPVGGGSAVGALDDLSDVTITSPAEDDTLRYIGGMWVNDNRRWEAVTDGEDVFVWEGDALVHDWETY